MHLSQIRSLTSFRFFAAWMVLSSHLPLALLIPNQNSQIKIVLYNIFQEGYVGVTFFFTLSGFILTYKYYHLVKQKKIKFREFIILRIARLYPTHLLAFIASLPIIFLSYTFNAHSVQMYICYFVVAGLCNLFLIQSFIPSSIFYFSFNSVTWSISTEAFLYCICYFLLSATLKTMVKITFLLFIIILFLIKLSMYYQFNSDINEWLFYINPFERVLDFIIGMSLAKFFLKERCKEIKYSYTNTMNKLIFTILELLSLLMFVIFLYFSIACKIDHLYKWDLFYLVPIVSVIFIFAFEKGVFSTFFMHPLFVFLGEISFGIYMFHLVALRYISYFIAYFNLSFITICSKLSLLLIIVVSILIIASLSFIFYEKKLNIFIRKTLINRNMKNHLQITKDISVSNIVPVAWGN